MTPVTRLIDDLENAFVDKCIVCGGDREERMRRYFRGVVGGAYGSIEVEIEYCADDPKCGEQMAHILFDQLVAQFVVADLRRRGTGLMDLAIPPEEPA